MDDYEAGTWTPSFNGYSTGFSGKYTKIGNVVHCVIQRWANIPSGSITGGYIVTGLPFVSNQRVTGTLGHARAANSENPAYIINNGSDQIGIIEQSDAGSSAVYSSTHATYQGFTQNGSSSVIISWAFTYTTNS